MINRHEHKITINSKYTDNISCRRSDKSKINQVEKIVLAKLKEEGIVIKKNKNSTTYVELVMNNGKNVNICGFLLTQENISNTIKDLH